MFIFSAGRKILRLRARTVRARSSGCAGKSVLWENKGAQIYRAGQFLRCKYSPHRLIPSYRAISLNEAGKRYTIYS